MPFDDDDSEAFIPRFDRADKGKKEAKERKKKKKMRDLASLKLDVLKDQVKPDTAEDHLSDTEEVIHDADQKLTQEEMIQEHERKKEAEDAGEQEHQQTAG